MDDVFQLPVTFKGKTLNLPAQLIVYGYSHRILVWIDDLEIVFEPDEERNYRASIDPAKSSQSKLPEMDLLAAIAAEIEKLVK